MGENVISKITNPQMVQLEWEQSAEVKFQL